jgi:hypothetical protein
MNVMAAAVLGYSVLSAPEGRAVFLSLAARPHPWLSLRSRGIPRLFAGDCNGVIERGVLCWSGAAGRGDVHNVHDPLLKCT